MENENNDMSGTTTPPVPSASSVNEDDSTQQPQQREDSSSDDAASKQQEEELLSDVTAAIHRIVSSSPHAEQHDGVTLNERQLTSLRKLEINLRNMMNRQQRGFRRVITGDENLRVRDFSKHKVKRTSAVVQKKVRKVVTGSSETKLRDWAKESKVVKTVDKFSFVLGVFCLCSTEFMALQHPEHFGIYYVVLISVMMALRLYMYTKNGWQYFLIDYCYFCNLACFVSVLAFPQSYTRLWRLNFAVSNGTLLGALLAWRNSLVFHSLDKVTSIAIHFLPGLLTYLERWSDDTAMCLKGSSENCLPLGFSGAMLEPILFYSLWQLLYILQTEIIDRKHILANPSIQTSMRWLTRDKKNSMHRIAKRVCRALGVLQPTEEFDPEALKTKMVFWISQLLFTVVTLLPVPLLFANRAIHTGYIIFVLSAAVYNGSNYYFEVFAARYLQKLESREKSSRNSSDGGGVKQD